MHLQEPTLSATTASLPQATPTPTPTHDGEDPNASPQPQPQPQPQAPNNGNEQEAQRNQRGRANPGTIIFFNSELVEANSSAVSIYLMHHWG